MNEVIICNLCASYYHGFKQALISESDSIKKAKLSSTFYVKRVHIDQDSGAIIIDGSLQRWVGERFISKESKRYLLKFRIHNYMPLLTAFKEIDSGEKLS